MTTWAEVERWYRTRKIEMLIKIYELHMAVQNKVVLSENELNTLRVYFYDVKGWSAVAGTSVGTCNRYAPGIELLLLQLNASNGKDRALLDQAWEALTEFSTELVDFVSFRL